MKYYKVYSLGSLNSDRVIVSDVQRNGYLPITSPVELNLGHGRQVILLTSGKVIESPLLPK
jgi:hypothetical protein